MLRAFSEDGQAGARADGDTITICADACMVIETVMDAFFRNGDVVGMAMLEEKLKDDDTWKMMMRHILERSSEDFEFNGRTIANDEEQAE